MFNLDPLRIAIFALIIGLSGIGLGSIAAGQESTLSTTPLSTLPAVSNERLGTGVPSRLPKIEVQRPVFTIQSGGPVAKPLPQYRPIRETTMSNLPANEIKNTLPMIEQTRPWQKSGNEVTSPSERQPQTVPLPRPVVPQTAQSRILPMTPTMNQIPPRSSGELPSTVHKTIPATVVSPTRPVARPAAVPVPASAAPARVLNFSIN